MKDENAEAEPKTVNLPPKELPFKPLTLDEMHEAAHKRLSRITKEFRDGFEFVEQFAKSVTFFGSARFKEDHPYYEKAASLANRIVSDLGYAVFTGGGPGIMEAANKGAFEAGGDSLGLTIRLPHEQVTNPYLTNNLNFYYFFSRKVCMTFAAEAYICFPGGFGTLDEFTEILTLVQTNKIEKVPIILYGNDFWNGFDKFVREQLLEAKTVDREDLNLYVITEDENKIIDIIRNARVRNGVKYHYD